MDTDYTDWIMNFNETDTTSLKLCLKKKLADEIEYIQTVAGPDLQKFIQMIRHKYMIDNVINIIEGSKNKTAKEIIQTRSEPLGYLPEISGLINLDVRKIDELYEDVLNKANRPEIQKQSKYVPTSRFFPMYAAFPVTCPTRYRR